MTDPAPPGAPFWMTPPDPALAVETRALARRFGRHDAVAGIDLRVPTGSVYGFLGLNGSGKSTTLRMLMGLLTPSGGAAALLGGTLDPAVDDLEVKRRVGYVPDTPSFYEWMTVAESLAFVRHYRKARWDDARAAHLLKAFDVPTGQRLDGLSRGQRAKVALVQSLAFHPDLLILDEATLGLDPLARRQFTEGLLAEYADGTRTVVVSSHLIHEIAGIVDHVGILKDGQLIRQQRSDALLAGLKRARLVYDDAAAPTAFAVDGLMNHRVEGREALLAIDNFDPARTPAQLARLGARTVTVEDLTLEEAFLELAAGGAPPLALTPEAEEPAGSDRAAAGAGAVR